MGSQAFIECVFHEGAHLSYLSDSTQILHIPSVANRNAQPALKITTVPFMTK